VSKITLLGGGGVRTPFLVYGLNEAADAIGATELVLYDVDHHRANLMCALGNAVVRKQGGHLKISVCGQFDRSVADSSFVINSVRVGGMASRANDERIAVQHGLAGQETTGPGGLAMALRTVPVCVQYAKSVERLAPAAWFINFTNPAGIITQAITTQTGVRSVGICDTPRELFHRVAQAVGGSPESVDCDYFGLNHLGWIRTVRRQGKDVTAELLASDEKLKSLYSADLFDPQLIRQLRLIPTEYLYFCYSQRRAVANQKKTGATRGQEVMRLTTELFRGLQQELDAGCDEQAIELYTRYHRQRIGSYMKLEASAGSLLAAGVEDPTDPFTSPTGYHRIAIQVMKALQSGTPQTLVVNTSNRGALTDLREDDVVEVPCHVSSKGIAPLPVGSLPSSVRGLLLSVKAYERLAVEAALERCPSKARLALLLYPIVGQWELASTVLEALGEGDPQHLGYLRQQPVSA
jgi:6-phospho-beta-glucosidase